MSSFELVLFQLRGHGYPQDDPIPNFFSYSKNSISGLLNEVSFVPEFLWECGQNIPNLFLKTCCKISIAHHCIYKL